MLWMKGVEIAHKSSHDLLEPGGGGGDHNMEASSLGIYWFSAYKRKSCLTMKVVSVIFSPRYSKKNRNEQSEYESWAGEVAP